MRARWTEILAVWSRSRRRVRGWPHPLPDRTHRRDVTQYPVPPLPVRMLLAIFDDIDPHDRFNT